MKLFAFSPTRMFTEVLVLLFIVSGCAGPKESADKTPPSGETGRWEVIGPGGGGSMFTPTVDPADPEHVFLRCDMTGAYVTFDGGSSWKMLNLRTVVQDFAFDPLQPDRAYAANQGLYVTEDRGLTWRLIYPSPDKILAERMVNDHAAQYYQTGDSLTEYSLIEKVRVDPENSDRLYAGWAALSVSRDSLPPLALGDSTAILYSADRGASWRKLGRVFGRHVLALFPGSWRDKPDEVTVVTDRACVRISTVDLKREELRLPAESLIAAAGGKGEKGSVLYVLSSFDNASGKPAGGVFRSTDSGASWEAANAGLLEDWKLNGKLPFFNTLGVCESVPEAVYLSCRSYRAGKAPEELKEHFGVLKSLDAGRSWEWVYRSDGNRVFGDNYRGSWMVESYGPGYTGNPHGLGVSPANPDICYSTDYGRASRTLDGGRTWEQLYADKLPGGGYSTRGLDVTTCYGVHFDPFDKNHLFITYTDIGLFQSHDGGASWVHSLKGVPEDWWNTCYWLVFDPSVKDRIWSVWGNGHALPRLKMFRRPGFVDNFQGGVALSEDGGRTWRRVTSGMPDNTDCTHILLDPSSPAEARTLYVCGTGRGVFKSTDSGASWKTANQGLGENLYSWETVRLPDGTLYLLMMRALKDDRILGGGLYRSSDGAESWSQVELPMDVTGPNGLTFDPEDPEVLYLSCWPRPSGGMERGGGLLRSVDGGKNWKRVFRGDAHVYAAAVDPANPETVIINTFDSAAFRSEDRGLTWRRLEGYDFKWGHRPIFDAHHPGMLYLTTFGGSVFYGPATGVPGAKETIENWTPTWRWDDYTGEGE